MSREIAQLPVLEGYRQTAHRPPLKGEFFLNTWSGQATMCRRDNYIAFPRQILVRIKVDNV